MTERVVLLGGPKDGEIAEVDPRDTSIVFPGHLPGFGMVGYRYAIETHNAKPIHGVFVSQGPLERGSRP